MPVRICPTRFFHANGKMTNGAEVGVSIGVFETGSDTDLMTELKEASPNAALTEEVVSRLDAVRVSAPDDGRKGPGRRVTSDYWVSVPHRPGTVAVVRFWTDDSNGSDEMQALEDFMVGSFSLILPAHWSGVQRPASQIVYKAADEASAEEDGWRFAGWRLGTIFKTARLRDSVATSASQSNPKPRDAAKVLVVFVAWLGATLATIGFDRFVIIPGGVASLTAFWSARKLRGKAALGLAVFLAVLLGLGLAFR